MIPLIDSHVHLWDTNSLQYPWLDEFTRLREPYLLSDFDDAAAMPDSSFRVQGIVAVQADARPDQSLAEVDLLSNLVGVTPILGIVAYAGLDRAGVQSEIGELALRPLVKGVRRSVQNEPDGMLTSPDYIEGIVAAHDAGLAVDICARSHQLKELAITVNEITHRVSQPRIVLDHAGKPPISSGEFESWRLAITALAAIDGVYCKLSGLVTETTVSSGGTKQLEPYIEAVVHAFGPSRTMFGSDWPVLNLESTYDQWFSVVEKVVGPLGESAAAEIFGGTAVSAYRL